MKNTPNQLVSRSALLASIVFVIGLASGRPPAVAAVWNDALALYHFDDNLNDSNGGNHGIGRRGQATGVIDPVFTNVGESDKPAWSGSALLLNGGSSGRYVDLGQGEDNAFQLTGDMTLFIRVYLDEGSVSPALISKYGFNSATDRSYHVRLSGLSGQGGENGGTITFSLNGNFNQAYTSTSIVTGEWMDLAVVFEASTRVSLYLNGENVLTTLDAIPSSIINNPSVPLLIGAQPYNLPGIGESGLDGMVETVAIWNRALSHQEVMSLSVIPEPSTLSLLILIGGGVLYRISSRRASNSNQSANKANNSLL